MVRCAEFLAKHRAGLFRHGVIAAGEHINSCIAAFRPGVDGDVGFRQKSQTGHALRLEPMGDEVEKGRTSTFGCGGDAGSQEGFVVELAVVAVVELKNAVFAHHVGGIGSAGVGDIVGINIPPSRIGMQARQALLHQVNKNG